MRRKLCSLGNDALFSVITVHEACKYWYLSEGAVKMAINTGRLNARKSGKTWLISLESMKKAYGNVSIPE